MVLVYVYATKLFTISTPRRLLLLQGSHKKRVVKTTYIRITFGLNGTVNTCTNKLPVSTKLNCQCPTLINIFVMLVNFITISLCSGERSIMFTSGL